MTRAVRLRKLEPSGRGEPRWAIPGAEHYQVEGVLDETEPTVDGRWRTLPYIAVWVVVDLRLMSPLGIPRHGYVVHGSELLRDVRTWIDEHVDDLVAGTAVAVPPEDRLDRLGQPLLGRP